MNTPIRLFFRVLLWLLAGILLLVITLLLLLRTAPVQQWIADKTSDWLSEESGGDIQLGKFRFSYSGDILLEDLHVVDPSGDTLLNSRHLHAQLNWWTLPQQLTVKSLRWDGLQAQVLQAADSSFNFDFLLLPFRKTGGNAVEDSSLAAPVDSSAGGSMLFRIGPVTLRNFKLSYSSLVDGLSTQLALDSLALKVDSLLLDAPSYQVKDLYIQGLQLVARQEERVPGEKDSSMSGPLPRIGVQHLNILNSRLQYSAGDADYQAQLGRLALQLPVLNLEEQFVRLDSLILNDSRVSLRLPPAVAETPTTTLAATAPAAFQWPQWRVQLRSVSGRNNQFQLQQARQSAEAGFDPQAMDWQLGAMQLQATYLPGDAGLHLLLNDWQEASGLGIDRFETKATINKQMLQLSRFDLRYQQSQLSADGHLGYAQVDQLFRFDTTLQLGLHLRSTGIHPLNFVRLLPDSVQQNPRLKPLLPIPFRFDMALAGDLQAVALQNLNLDWGEGTRLTTAGTIQQPLRPTQLQLTLPKIALRSVYNDLNLLYPDTSLAWPAELQIDAGFSGGAQHFSSGIRIGLPGGTAFAMVAYDQAEESSYTLDADVQGEAWAQLFKIQEIGELGLGLHFSGSGKDLESLQAKLDGELETIEYRGERYDLMQFSGTLDRQELQFKADINEMPLAFDLAVQGRLDSFNPRLDMKLRLIRANLKTLGIREEELIARMNLEAHYEAQGADLEARLRIADGLLQTADARYPVDSLVAYVQADSNRLEAWLQSELAAGEFTGNANLEQLQLAFRRQLGRFLPTGPTDSLLRNDIFLHGRIDLFDNRLLSDLLVPDLERLDSSYIALDFNQKAKRLAVKLKLPAVDYAGTELRALAVELNSSTDSLSLRSSFGRIRKGNFIDIHPTEIRGDMVSDTLLLRFKMEDAEAHTIYNVHSHINRSADTTRIHLLPEGLLLQGMPWRIPADNYIRFAPAFVQTEAFELQHKEEHMGLNQLANDALSVVFEGFRLSNLSALLRADTVPLRGRLEGELSLEQLFTKPAMQARLAITRLRLGEEYLGNLRLQASNPANDAYQLSLGLSGGGIKLRLAGSYQADPVSPLLHLQMQLDTLQMSLLTAFSKQFFSQPQGYISAKFDINGSLAEPIYTGEMRFKGAGLHINQLNSSYSFPDEKVRVDNAGVYLSRLQIRDGQGQMLELDGSILTPRLLKTQLNLGLKATNFQLINAQAANNPMFYGQATVSTNAKITGSFSQPKIDMRAKLNKGSRLWFVVPESQVALVEREGVVLFVDMHAAGFDSLFTEVGTRREVTGLTLTALFEVDPDTRLTLLVDERSGDQLVISGKADLRYELFPNGRMTLSGIYEVSSGSYDLSLYEVIQRKFELVPGSTIAWRGDPLDAALNLRALYRVKTNAVDLMSEQLSGADQSTLNRYRQELPFEVYTNIRGELLKPAVSFALDMPENQRSALDGNVYARVQQLNQQESEVNKQVFSLLVLNRFIPAGGGGTQTAGSGALARSSASQLLSGQLNNLSAKYIKAVELDLNLNSYTDFQSGQGQDRTVANINLRKNLFNERVVVQIGSQVDLEGSQRRQQNASDIFGDVSVEYLITEDGVYRVRAFRRNQFEGALEGQLIISGTSLVYNREFNKFSEAFRRRHAAPKQEDKP